MNYLKIATTLNKKQWDVLDGMNAYGIDYTVTEDYTEDYKALKRMFTADALRQLARAVEDYRDHFATYHEDVTE